MIIPAHNEQQTVAQVVCAARECLLVTEVLVVSDGSSDKTAEVARQAGAQVLELYPNRGKGGAMKAGVARTTAEIILFIDADLVGLRSHHVEAMLRPVLEGRVSSTLGIFGSGRLLTDAAQRVAPFLSGQRAITRAVLAQAPDFASSGWGVEIMLTRYLQRAGHSVMAVQLPDVTQVMKEEKRGLIRGFVSRLRMYWHIVRALIS